MCWTLNRGNYKDSKIWKTIPELRQCIGSFSSTVALERYYHCYRERFGRRSVSTRPTSFPRQRLFFCWFCLTAALLVSAVFFFIVIVLKRPICNADGPKSFCYYGTRCSTTSLWSISCLALILQAPRKTKLTPMISTT